ncbi:hypothetical protein A4X09_0g482 [Tilletia walkeri]|uniref:Las1-domain-containing protein n=1 Tax=Tilletia walkeri TaxID=117179 RepID=A0A8X7NEQ5_9BASI|nr:hypothetical protein A4X09_0g482 [Tilletia walkeri]
MRVPRRTPYLQSPASELKAVHDLLYSRKTADRRAGLDRISVWLNRSACPYAAENTAALVEAQLSETSENESRPESMASRLSLNMAIVRFVNSLVDSYQTGMFAAPVKTIAMQVQLPLWLVELRHAGTHDELPSLESLRTASELALEWLDKNFWAPSIAEADKLSGDDSISGQQDDIVDGFPEPIVKSTTGFESDLDVMRRRIEEAERLKRLDSAVPMREKPAAPLDPLSLSLPSGWRIAASEWTPSPIGLLDGRIPELDL